MALDLAALTTEITTDPENLGYAPFRAALQDQQITDLLNDPEKGGIRPRVSVDAATALGLLHPDDEDALPNAAAVGRKLDRMAMTGSIVLMVPNPISHEMVDSQTKVWLEATFPPTTVSGQALLAGINEPVSRAQKLFGQNVTNLDVAAALADDPARQPEPVV